MTRELRRARRDLMQEKPHPRIPKVVRSWRCKCETPGAYCVKHGRVSEGTPGEAKR